MKEKYILTQSTWFLVANYVPLSEIFSKKILKFIWKILPPNSHFGTLDSRCVVKFSMGENFESSSLFLTWDGVVKRGDSITDSSRPPGHIWGGWGLGIAPAGGRHPTAWECGGGGWPWEQPAHWTLLVKRRCEKSKRQPSAKNFALFHSA